MTKGSTLFFGAASLMVATGLFLSSLSAAPVPTNAGATSIAQETVQEEQSDDMPRAKPRRLPTYYSRVVTQQQREEIYQIQARFEEEIVAIQAQLEAKIKERDAEVEAVLEPDQLDEVKRLLAEAAKRREARRGGSGDSEGDSEGDGDGR